MSLKAIIFDVDGTLAETEDLHLQAFNEAFAEKDISWRWDDELYLKLLRITGGKERMRAFQQAFPAVEQLTQSEIVALHEYKTIRYSELVASGMLKLRPGISDLMDRGREAGLKLAISTTTSRPNIEALSEAVWGCSAAEKFDVIAAGDEVPKKKPAPDVYLLALDRLGLEPEACVALEDSEAGVASAKAARLPVWAAPSRFTRHHDLSAADRRAPGFENFAEMLNKGS